MNPGLLMTCLALTGMHPEECVVMESMIGAAKGRTNVIGALFMGILLTLSLFHTSIIAPNV